MLRKCLSNVFASAWMVVVIITSLTFAAEAGLQQSEDAKGRICSKACQGKKSLFFCSLVLFFTLQKSSGKECVNNFGQVSETRKPSHELRSGLYISSRKSVIFHNYCRVCKQQGERVAFIRKTFLARKVKFGNAAVQ